jgi:hypothetical protein
MPKYFRKVNRQFKVKLIVDSNTLPEGTIINFTSTCPDSIKLLSHDTSFIVEGSKPTEEFSISFIGHRVGDVGQVIAVVDLDNEIIEAKCEIIIKSDLEDSNKFKDKEQRNTSQNVSNQLFRGFEFKALDNEVERTRFDEMTSMVFINTDAPTVSLYFSDDDSFRDDKAGLVLLAELLMDCITEQLARKFLSRSAIYANDSEGIQAHKQDFIRKYGSLFHKQLLNL